MIFISDKQKSLAAFKIFVQWEKNWLLHVLRWPVSKSSERPCSTEKPCIMVSTGNLNSEQLVFGLEWKFKIMTIIIDEAEKFEGIQTYSVMERN